jgi:hypothetical protein
MVPKAGYAAFDRHLRSVFVVLDIQTDILLSALGLSDLAALAWLNSKYENDNV